MQKKIPVNVITGFLGAGKTTLINEMLTRPMDEKIVVIVNEYGDVGVDHQLVVNVEEEVFQMNNGCICCTLRTDLADTLTAIKNLNDEGKLQVDRVVIETTGLAEPSPIAQTFFRTPILQENYELDSVLTLVDATNVLYQIDQYEESVEQIAFADQILVTKAEEVTAITLNEVKRRVSDINSYAPIQDLDLKNFNPHSVLGRRLFTSSKIEKIEEEQDAISHSHENHHNHHHDHDHDHHTNEYDTISLQTQYPLHPVLVDMWMNELIMTFGMDLLRYKGVLHLFGDTHKVVYQGVNMAFKAELGEPWGENEERNSTLVFIGKNLAIDEIKSSFEKCILGRKLMEELAFTEEEIEEITGGIQID